MDLDSYFLLNSEKINKRLQELIPPMPNAPFQRLYEAARYSLLSSGKRLRPIFTLATVDMFGGIIEAAINPACALEMIHTYSLIHDDLPCMDNDDYRRGQPTLHKAYPEATALLAGDFLLTYSFQVLAEAPHLSESKKLALISLLSKRVGGEELIGGQIMDLEAEGKSIPFENIELIHLKKTGALISAAFEFGAIISNASKEESLCLRRFGYQVGLAFQIVDDILDLTQGEAKHGKKGLKVCSDLAKQKATSVTYLGLEGAYQMASRLINEANGSLEHFSFDPAILQQITEYVISRKH